MRAVAAGDAEAFRGLYDRHWRRVYRLAYGVLMDEDEARDVVQEVFLRVYRKAGTWRGRGRLESWLYRITVNAASSWRRGLQRFRRKTWDPEVAGPSGSPAAARPRRLDGLVAELARLGPRQRAVLALHLDAELGPKEIAAVLRIRPGAARVALHRAIKRLRATAAGRAAAAEAAPTQRRTENEA